MCVCVARALLLCCARSKDCEVLAEKLNSAGITAAYYHADMEPGTRAASHRAWSEGHVKVGCNVQPAMGSTAMSTVVAGRMLLCNSLAG